MVIAVVWVQVVEQGVGSYMALVAIWFYVDDIVAQLPLDKVADFIAHWEAVLPQFKMHLQFPKCKVHVLALRRVGWTVPNRHP